MGEVTREELAAMTDQELLAYEREHHGDPYLTLLRAKGMQRIALRFWHAAAARNKADREAEVEARRRLLQKLFPSDSAIVLRVVELRRLAGHSQGRRLGVLWARVIDDLRDFNVFDRRCDAVKVGHPLTKLVGEELKRRLFRIPDVEVVRPSGGLVQCEELEAKAWHAFERCPSIVGNTDYSRAVERILVLERDVDTNHGSSCGLSAAGRDGPM
jgi:hypothetical protein